MVEAPQIEIREEDQRYDQLKEELSASQPNEETLVSMVGLQEPTVDGKCCRENSDVLNAFEFTEKPEENRSHYDSYAK